MFVFAHLAHQGLANHTTDFPNHTIAAEGCLPLLRMTLTESRPHELCSRAPSHELLPLLVALSETKQNKGLLQLSRTSRLAHRHHLPRLTVTYFLATLPAKVMHWS